MLRQVAEVPEEPRALKEPFTARDIRSFIRLGIGAAEISYPNRTAVSTYNSALRYIKKHGLRSQVHVARRDGHVFLEKVEAPR